MRIQIACYGFYADSRHSPVFTDKAAAEAWLQKYRPYFHRVKPEYPGQDWQVLAFDLVSEDTPPIAVTAAP